MNRLILYIIAIFGCCFLYNNCKKGTDQYNIDILDLDTLNLEIFNPDFSIRAIFPMDEQTLWFAGTGGKFGFTEDGGQSFHIDSISHPDQPNLEFRSIAVVEGNVFLLSVASPALLFWSGDQGQNWDVVYRENDTLAFYDAMVFWDENEGIAMGDPTDNCLSIIKTLDGGKNWKKIKCSNLPTTREGEAAFAASNSNIDVYEDHVWIVSGGSSARVFHSPDRGDTWEVYETPIVQGGQMTGIFTCDFFDANTGIIFGGDWSDKELNYGNKAISYDGGKNWELIAEGSYPGYRSCVQFLDSDSPDHLMAVGIPGIAYSADLGQSWVHVTNQSFYTFRKSGSVIWLAGNNKIGRWKVE